MKFVTREVIVVATDEVDGGEGPLADGFDDLQGRKRGWKLRKKPLKTDTARK